MLVRTQNKNERKEDVSRRKEELGWVCEESKEKTSPSHANKIHNSSTSFDDI